MGSFAPDQLGWGVYFDDGTEVTSTQHRIHSDGGTDLMGAKTPGYTYHFRVLIDEAGMSAGTLTTPNFEYNKNSAGWNVITTSSSVVKAVSTSNIVDGNNTTQRLGSGTFITTNAWQSDDGSLPSLTFVASEECEAICSIQLVKGDVADGDTVELRLSGLTSYGEACSITVSENDIISDDFSSGTLEAHWTEVDPIADCDPVSFEGASPDQWITFTIPSGSTHDTDTSTFEALHIIQTIGDVDFEVQTKFETVMDSTQWKSFGIVFLTTATVTYGQLVAFYNGTNVELHFDYDGTTQKSVELTGIPSAPFWLRLNRTGDTWASYYSLNGTDFIKVVSDWPGPSLTIEKIGLMAGNWNATPSSAPEHIAKMDYFWDNLTPMFVEDPAAGGPARRIMIIS